MTRIPLCPSSLIVLPMLTLLAAGCEREAQAPPPIEFKPGQLVSSKDCAKCHTDIYAAWLTSVHARSATNPIFRESFNESLQVSNGQTKELCQRCHAPIAGVTGDHDLKHEVTREGVNCDFCHSLKDANLADPYNPFVVKVGKVKFGPVRDAASTGHAVAFSEFHTQSLMCASCHEYTNPNGVPILSTYTEWKKYTDEGGDKTCQQCHMPVVMANIVDPKVKRIQGGFVNLHRTPGGHSLDQLSKSLRLRITRVSRTNRGLDVEVRVRNVGAGHMVPTGLPTRKVILNLDVQADDGRTSHQDRVYQRTLLDDQGKEVTRDSLIFTQAQSGDEDSRLAPGEERVEKFSLAVPSNRNLVVVATLTYFYSPHGRKETETRIDFATDSKELRVSWGH